MILLIIKTSHMSEHKLSRQSQTFPDLRPLVGAIGESAGIYRIMDNLDSALPHRFTAEYVLPGKFGTCKAMVCFIRQISPEEFRGNPFCALYHTRISGVRHRNGNPALLSNRKINTGSARHMSLHYLKLMMFSEEIPHRSPVYGIIVNFKLGKHINMASQARNFLIIKFRFSVCVLTVPTVHSFAMN